jgi:cytochrome c biogenesis protein CcmG/thiol:disulfide interchange protein DsbE
MIRKWLAFTGFIVLCGFLYRGLQLHPQEMPSVVIGQKLPVVEVMENQTGQKVKISQWFGQPMLIHFWASWCENCAAEMPLLMAWTAEHPVRVIGVDYKDNEVDSKKWWDLWGNVFTGLLNDPKGKFAFNLGVVATPETFLIDAQGIVQYRYQGLLTPEILATEIEPRLKKMSDKHV